MGQGQGGQHGGQREHQAHLLLHDGHGGPCQQEGLEWHQIPEPVLHLVVALDDVSPGLADRAEEYSPAQGDEDGGL